MCLHKAPGSRKEFSELFPQIDEKLLEDDIEMNLRAEKNSIYIIEVLASGLDRPFVPQRPAGTRPSSQARGPGSL